MQDPVVVASILAAAVDVTVLMTPDGIICDQVIAGPDLPQSVVPGLARQSACGDGDVESRPKIEQMLGDAADGPHVALAPGQPPGAWRPGYSDQLQCRARRPHGHIIAIGRDMSKFPCCRSGCLSAEQAVEQEYQRLRNSETRFRVLLQSATDAIMIVDAEQAVSLSAIPLPPRCLTAH